MGIVQRHARAPYIDGETLPASDLERDIAGIRSEMSGNITNPNLSPSADLQGSKLASQTLLAGRFKLADTPSTALADGALISGSFTAETIETLKIALDISQADEGENAGTTNLVYNTWVDLGVGVALTLSDSPLSVLVFATARYRSSLVGGDSNERPCDFRLRKDGNTLHTTRALGQGGGVVASEDVMHYIGTDPSPVPSSSPVYSLEANEPTHSGAAGTIRYANLIVVELRR